MTMPLHKLLGREVTLTLRNFSATLTGPFAAETPKTYDLKGVVLHRPRGHDDPDTFGFGVKFTEVPMRVVHIRHVLAVDGAPMLQPAPSKPAREWKVKSSKGDKEYTVRENNGTWTCTCPANSDFHKLCRHIKEIRGEK